MQDISILELEGHLQTFHHFGAVRQLGLLFVMSLFDKSNGSCIIEEYYLSNLFSYFFMKQLASSHLTVYLLLFRKILSKSKVKLGINS